MNWFKLTLTLYLHMAITREVSLLPLAQNTEAKLRNLKTVSSKAKNILKKALSKRQGRSAISYPAFLYTRHTGKFVKVTAKEINALTTKDNKYAELILTSHGLNGEHSIQGKHSKRFICMNDRGEVTLKKTFTRKNCMFYMKLHENGYVTFRLVSNTKWFLGFKKSGEIKHGHSTEYNHKAAWMIMQRPLKRT